MPSAQPTRKVNLTEQIAAITTAKDSVLPSSKALSESQKDYVGDGLEAAAKSLRLFQRFETQVRALLTKLLDEEKAGGAK